MLKMKYVLPKAGAIKIFWKHVIKNLKTKYQILPISKFFSHMNLEKHVSFINNNDDNNKQSFSNNRNCEIWTNFGNFIYLI